MNLSISGKFNNRKITKKFENVEYWKIDAHRVAFYTQKGTSPIQCRFENLKFAGNKWKNTISIEIDQFKENQWKKGDVCELYDVTFREFMKS